MRPTEPGQKAAYIKSISVASDTLAVYTLGKKELSFVNNSDVQSLYHAVG